MTGTYVAERAHKIDSTGAVNETVNIASNCTAGNRIILILSALSPTHGNTATVSDTKGNTWTVDGLVSSNDNLVLIASTGQDAGTLTSSDHLTVAFGAAPSNVLAWVEEFSFSYAGDVTTNNGSGSGVTTLSTGTTASPAGANETAVALFCGDAGLTYTINQTGTVGAYSRFTTGDQSSSSGNNDLTGVATYQVGCSSAGQIHKIKSSAQTLGYQALIVVYKTNTLVTADDSSSGSASDTTIVSLRPGDASSGADSSHVGPGDSETASGADTSSTAATVTDSDVASGSELGIRLTPDSDAGSGADNASVSILVFGTDAGSGVDNGSAIIATPVVAADVGSGADVVAPALGIVNADAASGDDEWVRTTAIIIDVEPVSCEEVATPFERPQGDRVAVVQKEQRTFVVVAE